MLATARGVKREGWLCCTIKDMRRKSAPSLRRAPCRLCALAKLPTTAPQSEGCMLVADVWRAVRDRKRKSSSSHTPALAKALTMLATTCGSLAKALLSRPFTMLDM